MSASQGEVLKAKMKELEAMKQIRSIMKSLREFIVKYPDSIGSSDDLITIAKEANKSKQYKNTLATTIRPRLDNLESQYSLKEILTLFDQYLESTDNKKDVDKFKQFANSNDRWGEWYTMETQAQDGFRDLIENRQNMNRSVKATFRDALRVIDSDDLKAASALDKIQDELGFDEFINRLLIKYKTTAESGQPSVLKAMEMMIHGRNEAILDLFEDYDTELTADPVAARINMQKITKILNKYKPRGVQRWFALMDVLIENKPDVIDNRLDSFKAFKKELIRSNPQVAEKPAEQIQAQADQAPKAARAIKAAQKALISDVGTDLTAMLHIAEDYVLLNPVANKLKDDEQANKLKDDEQAVSLAKNVTIQKHLKNAFGDKNSSRQIKKAWREYDRSKFNSRSFDIVAKVIDGYTKIASAQRESSRAATNETASNNIREVAQSFSTAENNENAINTLRALKDATGFSGSIKYLLDMYESETADDKKKNIIELMRLYHQQNFFDNVSRDISKDVTELFSLYYNELNYGTEGITAEMITNLNNNYGNKIIEFVDFLHHVATQQVTEKEFKDNPDYLDYKSFIEDLLRSLKTDAAAQPTIGKQKRKPKKSGEGAQKEADPVAEIAQGEFDSFDPENLFLSQRAPLRASFLKLLKDDSSLESLTQQLADMYQKAGGTFLWDLIQQMEKDRDKKGLPESINIQSAKNQLLGMDEIFLTTYEERLRRDVRNVAEDLMENKKEIIAIFDRMDPQLRPKYVPMGDALMKSINIIDNLAKFVSGKKSRKSKKKDNVVEVVRDSLLGSKKKAQGSKPQIQVRDETLFQRVRARYDASQKQPGNSSGQVEEVLRPQTQAKQPAQQTNDRLERVQAERRQPEIQASADDLNEESEPEGEESKKTALFGRIRELKEINQRRIKAGQKALAYPQELKDVMDDYNRTFPAPKKPSKKR